MSSESDPNLDQIQKMILDVYAEFSREAEIATKAGKIPDYALGKCLGIETLAERLFGQMWRHDHFPKRVCDLFSKKQNPLSGKPKPKPIPNGAARQTISIQLHEQSIGGLWHERDLLYAVLSDIGVEVLRIGEIEVYSVSTNEWKPYA